jgi:hypothetical protein
LTNNAGRGVAEISARWSHIKDDTMDFLKDLWGFLKERKKFWMLPIILVLLLFGVLIVLTGGSAIAPFIYAVF